jgi:hypothetical protein
VNPSVPAIKHHRSSRLFCRKPAGKSFQVFFIILSKNMSLFLHQWLGLVPSGTLSFLFTFVAFCWGLSFNKFATSANKTMLIHGGVVSWFPPISKAFVLPLLWNLQRHQYSLTHPSRVLLSGSPVHG